MGFLWSHCKWLAVDSLHLLLLLKRISRDHTGVQSCFYLLSLRSHPPLLPLWLPYKVSISCLLSVFISFFHFPFKSTRCLTHVVSLFFSFLVFSAVTIRGRPPFGIGSVTQSVHSASWVLYKCSFRWFRAFRLQLEIRGCTALRFFQSKLICDESWWR